MRLPSLLPGYLRSMAELLKLSAARREMCPRVPRAISASCQTRERR
jgi:hypothetical protein